MDQPLSPCKYDQQQLLGPIVTILNNDSVQTVKYSHPLSTMDLQILQYCMSPVSVGQTHLFDHPILEQDQYTEKSSRRNHFTFTPHRDFFKHIAIFKS